METNLPRHPSEAACLGCSNPGVEPPTQKRWLRQVTFQRPQSPTSTSPRPSRPASESRLPLEPVSLKEELAALLLARPLPFVISRHRGRGSRVYASGDLPGMVSLQSSLPSSSLPSSFSLLTYYLSIWKAYMPENAYHCEVVKTGLQARGYTRHSAASLPAHPPRRSWKFHWKSTLADSDAAGRCKGHTPPPAGAHALTPPPPTPRAHTFRCHGNLHWKVTPTDTTSRIALAYEEKAVLRPLPPDHLTDRKTSHHGRNETFLVTVHGPEVRREGGSWFAKWASTAEQR